MKRTNDSSTLPSLQGEAQPTNTQSPSLQGEAQPTNTQSPSLQGEAQPTNTQQYIHTKQGKFDIIKQTFKDLISDLNNNTAFKGKTALKKNKHLTTNANKKLSDDLVKKYTDIFEKNNLSTENSVFAIKYLFKHTSDVKHETLGKVVIGHVGWYLYNDIFKSIFNDVSSGKNVDHILDSLSGFKFPRSKSFQYKNNYKTEFIELIYKQLDKLDCNLSEATKQPNWNTKQSKIAKVIQGCSIIWRLVENDKFTKPLEATYSLINESNINQDNNLEKSQSPAANNVEQSLTINLTDEDTTLPEPIDYYDAQSSSYTTQYLQEPTDYADYDAPEFSSYIPNITSSASLVSANSTAVPLLTSYPAATQQLQQKDNHIEQLEQQLQEADYRIGQREQQLQEAEGCIEKLEQQLQQKDEQSVQQEQQLQEAEGCIEQQEQKLRQKEDQIAQQQQQLQEAEGCIEQQGQKLQEAEGCIEQQGQKLRQKEDQIAQQQQQLQEAEGCIEELEQQLQQKDEQSVQQKQQLQEAEGCIEQQEQKLRQKEDQIAQQEQQLQEAEGCIAQLQAAEDHIVEQEQQLRQKEDQIAQQHKLLVQKEEQFLEHELKFMKKNDQIAQQEQQLQQKEDQMCLFIACSSGNLQLVKHFESKGFNLTSKPIDNLTTYLEIARLCKQNNIVEYITSKDIGTNAITEPPVVTQQDNTSLSLGISNLTDEDDHTIGLNGDLQEVTTS